MSSKEELMRPVLVMGFFVFAVLTIISLLYLLSRLYIYRKYKNNLMKTKANTREQENEEENITVKIKANKDKSCYYYEEEKSSSDTLIEIL